MDRVDPDLVDRMEDQLAHSGGVQTVDRVRVRWIGHELHAAADADVSLEPSLDPAAHDVLEDARHRLLHRIPRLGDILLHAKPGRTSRRPRPHLPPLDHRHSARTQLTH